MSVNGEIIIMQTVTRELTTRAQQVIQVGVESGVPGEKRGAAIAKVGVQSERGQGSPWTNDRLTRGQQLEREKVRPPSSTDGRATNAYLPSYLTSLTLVRLAPLLNSVLWPAVAGHCHDDTRAE